VTKRIETPVIETVRVR